MNLNELIDVKEETINGFHIIRIKSGEFKDIEYVYGEVSFEEDTPTLKFVYEVLSEFKPNNIKVFENLLGDLLVAMIERQLETSSVIYHGGIDEVSHP